MAGLRLSRFQTESVHHIGNEQIPRKQLTSCKLRLPAAGMACIVLTPPAATIPDGIRSSHRLNEQILNHPPVPLYGIPKSGTGRAGVQDDNEDQNDLPI
jgi:hypothetical protein